LGLSRGLLVEPGQKSDVLLFGLKGIEYIGGLTEEAVDHRGGALPQALLGVHDQ